MLRPDPQLPFVEIAWSPTALGRLLSRRVLPAAGRGSELASAAIETMRYTPGENCVVLVGLRFVGDGRSRGSAVVTFTNGDGLQDVYTRHYCGDRDDGTKAVLLPEYSCLVELFPADWRLPALAHAMGQDGLPWTRTPASRSRTRVLRYRPHRRCVLLDARGAEEVIAKVYGPGPRAAQAAARQIAISAEASACGLVVPRPLALEAGGDVLLMERVRGTSLKQLLGRVRDGRTGALLARRAAEALTALHSMGLATAESRSLDDEMKRVQKPLGGLRLVAPALAGRVDELLEGVASAVELIPPPGPSVLVHGDFKPSQLLLHADEVAVVDLDRACRGDAAIDVGNFLAQFRKEALLARNGSLRRLGRPFLDEYLHRAPRAGLEERARVLEALALVRMAVRRFRMDPAVYAADPSRSLPALLLEEADTCLSERAA